MNVEFEGKIKMINRNEYSKEQNVKPNHYHKGSIHNKKFVLLEHKSNNLEFEIFYYNPYVFDESNEDFRRQYTRYRKYRRDTHKL